MSELTGTAQLTKLAFRRDRVMLAIWIAVLTGTAASSAAATVGLYPTVESRVRVAETLNRTGSLVALYGRIYDPTSLGAIAMVKLGGIGAVFVAVLSIVLVVRHTRSEEESGRLELVGAGVVGRHAPLTAALLSALGVNVALALLTAVALTSAGLPADGSLAFGVAWAGVGIAFAAVAAVTAQLSGAARSATGIAVAVLGFVYLLRAVGDAAPRTGPRWLSWLSPIGWGQQFRPYAGNRWWVSLITLGFAAAVAAAAYALVARRDLGAGLLPQRPGPPTNPSLRSPLTLAWRLHRGSLLAWSVGFAVLGLVFGNIASSVGDLLDSPQARDLIRTLGGERGLVDAFIGAELGFVGIGAAAYGVHAALRMRSEETGQRLEPILATPTGRLDWAWSHIVLAMVGTAALLLVAGIGAGLAHGAQVADLGRGVRVIGGALVQVPAAWIPIGIVVAAFGLAPRAVAVGWGALTAFVLLGELGPLLELDQLVMDLSPFTHVPEVPGSGVTPLPILAMTAVAAALIVAGLAGFRRRDVG